ncbi:MAG: nitroreductase family protein [Candidatus Bipolaricaulota bacterium]|jgi:nitroreductase|nr:nitroreductase family protein [Candidatus Bipolaricaulota bacterium]
MRNPVTDCLLNHRSIRKFKPDPIEPGKIDAILHAAIRTATAGNLQAYALVVVDDPKRLKEMKLDSAPAALFALVDQYRLKRWFEVSGTPFYNDQAANVLISFWDATIALQNAVVAAESLGLGTLYLGTVLSENVQEVLGAPQYTFPAGLVLLGYADETPALRPRLPLEAVVHRNRYHVPTDEEIRGFYREEDARYEALPEETKAMLRKKGVTNRAQHRTIGHYTEELIRRESEAILANLKRAGFRFTP